MHLLHLLPFGKGLHQVIDLLLQTLTDPFVLRNAVQSWEGVVVAVAPLFHHHGIGHQQGSGVLPVFAHHHDLLDEEGGLECILQEGWGHVLAP